MAQSQYTSNITLNTLANALRYSAFLHHKHRIVPLIYHVNKNALGTDTYSKGSYTVYI